MRRSPLVPALLAVCALAVGGCGSGGPAGTAPAVADPVGALLLRDVPAGFTLSADTAAQTGATDLAKAVSDDAQPDARTALTAEGFQHGYQRQWTDAAGDVIGLQVYRFAAAAGARADAARAGRIARAQASRVSTYPVDAAAHGYEVDVEGNRTEQIVGVSGRFVVQLVCTSRSDPRLRTRAITLARAQLERLTTGDGRAVQSR